MGVRRQVTVQPSAARLTDSLRDVGYDFPSAVADLVDNSLAAHASHVEIEIEFAGAESRVLIADDGCGMTTNGLNEALRFGSRRVYGSGDLGRYGLGLKTASLSQCRTVTVSSRRVGSTRASVRQLDLDLIAQWDEWLIVDPGRTATTKRSSEFLNCGFNTVVAWEHLDRVLPEKRPEGGWAKRRFDGLIRRTGEHLAMVFHRFIEGDHPLGRVDIVVNGEKIRAWNPFASDESATVALPEQVFELTIGNTTGTVRLNRYVLPHHDSFSSVAEFERMSGPLRWNRQQGLYIYRVGGSCSGAAGRGFARSTSTPSWPVPLSISVRTSIPRSTSTWRRCGSRSRRSSARCWNAPSTTCAYGRTIPTVRPQGRM